MVNIFKEIDDTATAYQNNPQGLEQLIGNDVKKNKNKGPLALQDSLVEIMALNELKQKVDASKRDITLKAAQARGQMPTIRENLEKSLIADTISDKVNGVAGIMANKAKNRNKYMNNMANKAAMTPAKIPTNPVTRPLRPKPMNAFQGGIVPIDRPNVQNMAKGGIIGYGTGDSIKSWITEAVKKIKEKGGEAVRNLKDSDIVQNHVLPAVEEIGYRKDILLSDANEIANTVLSKLPTNREIGTSIEGAIDLGGESIKGAGESIKGAIDRGGEVYNSLFEGEYSSPDPSVLGGGNTDTNAAVSQELGGLRSDLEGTGQEIKDLEGAISDADERIAQNKALQNRFHNEKIRSKHYLEGFPYYDVKDKGLGKLIPGTEQDLVDRNTAIRDYANEQYNAAVDARIKSKDDKKQFEEELAGAQEASSDITSEIMFLQDMARKARMGDPEAIAFMNAQGKRNIQKGLAGIYGDQNVDPAMMKMVEAQQFPSNAPVNSEAVEAAGKDKAGIKELLWGGEDGNRDGYVENLTDYPTYSPANMAANVVGRGKDFLSDLEAAKNAGVAKRNERLLREGKKDLTYPEMVEGVLEWAIDDKFGTRKHEGAITDAPIPPSRGDTFANMPRVTSDDVDIEAQAKEAFDASQGQVQSDEIDTDANMTVLDNSDSGSITNVSIPPSRGDTFADMPRVDIGDIDPALKEQNTTTTNTGTTSTSSGSSSGSGGIGSIGSMNDVIELISALENKYAGEKDGWAKMIYALTHMNPYGGGGAYGRASSQFDRMNAARATETAKMAINTMLKIQENNIRASATAMSAALRRDTALWNSEYRLTGQLTKIVEKQADIYFGGQYENNLNKIHAMQGKKFENRKDKEEYDTLVASNEAIKAGNPAWANLEAERLAVKGRIEQIQGQLGKS